MVSTPRVALLIETSRGYGRGLLRGIVSYARLYGPWSFYVTPGDFEQVVPKMEQWGGTGIIARVETARVAQALLKTKLPVITLDLSDAQLADDNPLSNLPEVRSDSRAAARLAAEHLLHRGFHRFAFVGAANRVWSRRRQDGFVTYLSEAGHEVILYETPRLARDREWGREQKFMSDWLRSLPKPVGLMACNDDRGRQVLEACRAAGLDVPHEIAVIGVDNDSLLCDLADPPLSSVALNAEQGGFEAAAQLARLMRGEKPTAHRIDVQPLHVVTRQSTDVVAIDDREVAAALRFIHDHAARPIQVNNIVAHVGLSRRALEIRFRKAVGRSMHDEMQRIRLEHAKRLLVETDLPIHQLAELIGFASASYLGVVFREQYGLTLRQFRARMRHG